MIGQIFVGGHFSSGTRVVQFLLKQKYNIYATGSNGKETEQQDYEPGFSVKNQTFVERYLRDEDPLWEYPKEERTMKEPFSIKNPDLMLAIPQIRKLYPEAKFILVVRNGIDQILCENRCMSGRFENFFPMKQSGFFEREMEFWNFAYKKAIEDKPDLIIRLEDLVNDTEKTVRKIEKFVGVDSLDYSIINKPASMDRRKISCSVQFGGINHNYEPSMQNKLCEIEGGDMMKYFDYI